jgi:hypothetical protein
MKSAFLGLAVFSETEALFDVTVPVYFTVILCVTDSYVCTSCNGVSR